jgi:Prokaryotic N-terminal methylation motif
MRRRSGFTLIEAVMSMTVGFILLGCGVRMLVLVMRLDRTERTRVNDDAALDRLARAFRGDVALAKTPPTNTGMEKGRLELARSRNESVRYQFEDEALVRTEIRGGQPVRRESYALPKHLEPSFDVVSRGGIAWVRMRWKAATNSIDGARVASVPIEAAVDRFGRLDRAGEMPDAK